MNTKRFTIPRVFLTDAMPAAQPGSGSGEIDKLKPVPCKFDEWMQSRWFGDYDQNDTVDFEDYARWWAQNGFGAGAWGEFNPDVAWNDEWIM